jgi:hypothetical protein
MKRQNSLRCLIVYHSLNYMMSQRRVGKRFVEELGSHNSRNYKSCGNAERMPFSDGHPQRACGKMGVWSYQS